MLAMEVRTPRGFRQPAFSFAPIASRLASTVVLGLSVGASMLAMEVRAPQGIRQPAFSFAPIASRLAPTVDLRRLVGSCSKL
jgi:hypothetical protein